MRHIGPIGIFTALPTPLILPRDNFGPCLAP